MSFKSLSFKYLLAGLTMLISLSVSAQKTERAHLDSLLRQMRSTKEDTNKVNLLIRVGNAYTKVEKADSVFFYLRKSLQLAEKLPWKKGIAEIYDNLGNIYYQQHDYTNAQNYLKKAVDAAFISTNYPLAFKSARIVARAMFDQNNISKGIKYLNSIIGRFENKGRTQELIGLYVEIAGWYQRESDFNAAANYFNRAQTLLETNPDKYANGNLIINIALYYIDRRQTDKARSILLKAQNTFRNKNDMLFLADDYDILSVCALQDRNYRAFVDYSIKAARIAEKIKYDYVSAEAENSIGWGYFLLKKYDSAYIHTKRAFLYIKNDSSVLIRPLSTLGSIYREATPYIMKDAGLKPGEQYEKSIALLKQSINFGQKHYDYVFAEENQQELALTYKKIHRYAEALEAYLAYYKGKERLDSTVNEKAILLREAQLHYSHKEDSLKYKESIVNAQLKQKKQQSYFFIGGIVALLILAGFIWLNFNNQRKSNKLLAEANEQVNNANSELNEQRKEITAQRDELAGTISNLKMAQTQLIQSEKMASLGELTAGIAHEIQNPLNFVNNFSEVSAEMVDELDEELDKGNITEAKAIGADLKQNLEKINHHGKRADFIVKGMLQHSRISTGERQPANINLLTNEFLKLSYHGLRAKDNNFNAVMITHFDDNLPKANVVQQDIGRALLNVFNNAFYAVKQQAAITGADYRPTVEVTTALKDNLVQITIKDNGPGIPDPVKSKIMQPFFTTKPTGEGTGLGLSLSYDIIVKEHGGQIDVNSVVGEFTEIVIAIPIS